MGVGQTEKKIRINKPVFKTTHGVDDIHSVSLAFKDANGAELEYVEAGQVLYKNAVTGYYAPSLVAIVAEDSSSGTVKVDKPLLFKTGSVIYNATADTWHVVSAVDQTASTITLKSAANSAAGDALTSSYSEIASLAATAGADKGGDTEVTVADGSKFVAKGKVVTVGATGVVKHARIKSIVGDKLTIEGAATIAKGDIIAAPALIREYRILVEDVQVKGVSNPIGPCRHHGTAYLERLTGFHDGLKAAFPGIKFDTSHQ